MDSRIRILLAEDNPADARLLREALSEADPLAFEIVHVTLLDDAVLRLSSGRFDVVLLDLSLPDAHGISNAERVRAEAPDVPIVILTGLDDDAVAVEALRVGAQDYLTKDAVSAQVLPRAIRLAIERKRIDVERQRIERMKDEFVALVSHELRTPLTSIRGALALLAEGAFGTLPERGQNLLKMACRNTDRLVRLVNEILDLERLQSGASPPSIRPVCAADLMVEAVDVMLPAAEEAGVRLAFTPLNANVMADPDRIIQTLTNLIGNAIKFSQPDSPVLLSGDLQDGMARFKVEDHGRGIPPEKIESIFERFQQVDLSDAREKGGTGLGLPICRAIIEQHGGRIWAESGSGQGASFYFTLPATREAVQLIVQPALTVEKPPTESMRRILVVDDNDDVRELAKMSLEMCDSCEVLTAASAAEGLAMAAKEHPDAILLDVMMPDMDGPTALGHLRNMPETRAIPVILLTAKITPRDRDQFAHLGVAEILPKPFDPLHLWTDVAKALGWGT